MSLNETRIDIPAEHVSNIFGQFDHNIKLIERTLNVTVVPRNEGIKVIGDTANVEGACKVFAELLQLAERGNMIDEQKVAYTLSLLGEHKEGSLVEIDKDWHLPYDKRQTGETKDFRPEGLCGCHP